MSFSIINYHLSIINFFGAAIYLPIVSAALKLTGPPSAVSSRPNCGLEGWVLVILASLVPCFLGQIFKWITR